MQFSTDQRHKESLDLLAEVRDFLTRWPPHPMMRPVIEKISAHLADPTLNLVRSHAYAQSGGAYTPVGLCIVRVSVANAIATVSLPPGSDAASESVILDALRNGQDVILKPDETA